MHTPGPWYTGESMDGIAHVYAGDFEGVGEGELLIAGVYADPDGEGDNFAAQSANARLIAAAPDLLEAARQVQGYLHGFANTTSRVGDLKDVMRQSRDALRVAIAKAAGHLAAWEPERK